MAKPSWPTSKESSRQWIRNRSSRTSTVMVPGVMVMELASTTLPASVRSLVWKDVTSGWVTSLGDQISRMVAQAALMTSLTRYRP